MTMTTPTFDMDAALQALREGKDLTGKDGILTPLIKQLTEVAMQAELDEHLVHDTDPNRKNGSTRKTMKSAVGSFDLNTPRDRAGNFEPQIVKKHQTQLTDELERKVLALYALGNSYQDIRTHIGDLYGMSLSNGTLNAVTDKLLPELQAWRERDLEAIYPDTEVQHCIVHQIRNSLKYVASKNQKAFMVDLKCVYKAATLNAAESALDELEAKWGEKYPMVIKSWRSKWPTLSAYFKYPDYVRKAIYTTNAVEAVHRQFRKLTKTKGGFANENSLLKLLYAGILKASERWTHPVQNWNLTLSQLAIHFPDRLDDHISL